MSRLNIYTHKNVNSFCYNSKWPCTPVERILWYIWAVCVIISLILRYIINFQCKIFSMTHVSVDCFIKRMDLPDMDPVMPFPTTWFSNSHWSYGKREVIQNTLFMNTAIHFECPICYFVMALTKYLTALFYNNPAITSYWCPPSRLCLSTIDTQWFWNKQKVSWIRSSANNVRYQMRFGDETITWWREMRVESTYKIYLVRISTG